ncbi:MAG: carotenoid biosynthesis protein [Pseudomonadota bacterium]
MLGGKAAQAICVGALLLWIAFTAIAIVLPAAGFAKAATFLAIVMLVGFCVLHSARRLRWRRTGILFGIAFVIANIYENLSISTGFPFGSYVHTAASGPWLFEVPIIVGPIFYSVCYIGWTLAVMILGDQGPSHQTLRTIGVPAVGAFIATGWDICTDPIGATIARNWIFAESGAYYGVPLANYLGWFLCTWTIIQCWTLYLAKTERLAEPGGLSYWYEAAAFWAVMALQFPLMMLANPVSRVVTDTGGWAWRSGDIVQAAVMMAIYSMLAAAITGALAVTLRSDENDVRPS